MVNLELHPKQRVVFEHIIQERETLLVAGRRFGKSRLGLNTLLYKALTFQGAVSELSPETVLATMPTAKQARRVIWKPLVSFIEASPRLASVCDINRTEMRLVFNGKPPIYVTGANDNNGDNIRGIRLYYCWMDEYQDTKPGVSDTVIQPALEDTPGSSKFLSGTPKGKLNHFYKEYKRIKDSFHFVTSDNPFVPASAIENAKTTLPPRIFRQEYEASFEEFEAQVFSCLTTDCVYKNVVDNPDLCVAGVDWGDKNPAIVIMKRRDGTWYLDDHWQPDGYRSLSQTEIFQQFYIILNRHQPSRVFCDPSRPSSIVELRKLGYAAVAGFNSIEEGITQVNSLFYQRRLMLPQSLYDIFLSYHREMSPDGTVLDRIAEGQNDHIIDATRYALAVKYSK